MSSPTNPQLKIGVVGIRDGWSTQQLVQTVEARTQPAALIEPHHLALDLTRGRVLHRDTDLGTFDAIIIKKLGSRYSPELLDRLELLRFVASQGVRIFSRPHAIMHALDRLTCTVTLRMAEIPMPPTVITEDLDAATAAVARFERVVLKPLYTSKARGMELLSADDPVRERLEAFRAAGNAMLYVQQLVELPGHDFGIAFLGGEYLGSYARSRRGDNWHTAMSGGENKYQRIEPNPEIIALARRAQAPFGLDFTCVDVVESAQGPLVFEVSAFGGFRGLRESCGINAAERYLDHVLRELTDGA